MEWFTTDETPATVVGVDLAGITLIRLKPRTGRPGLAAELVSGRSTLLLLLAPPEAARLLDALVAGRRLPAPLAAAWKADLFAAWLDATAA